MEPTSLQMISWLFARIDPEELNGSDIACLGSQLRLILSVLESSVMDYEWYAADVLANNSVQGLPEGPEPVFIGRTEEVMSMASLVDQFQSGLFFAVTAGEKFIWMDRYGTEDERSFCKHNTHLEIRAMDTSYFEVYSRSQALMEYLSQAFGVRIEVVEREPIQDASVNS